MPCNCFTYPCACENGDYYDDNGQFYPSDKKLPYNYVPFYDVNPPELQPHNCNPLYDRNCMNYDIPTKDTTRPLVNTNYGLSVNPNVNQWSFSDLFNPQSIDATNNPLSANPVSGTLGTIRAHPVIALGVAVALAYFFMGSGGGGTKERTTIEKWGFGG